MEPELDCQTCGACCGAWAPGVPFVAVSPADAARLAAFPHLVVASAETRSGLALATRAATLPASVCAALEGDPSPPGGRVRCGVYEARPAACRSLQPGDPHCLSMRARLGFEVARLPNPEQEWGLGASLSPRERAEAERRAGPLSPEAELLSRSAATLCLRLDPERTLRIHRRDPSAARIEAALLGHPWASLRVPRLIELGGDHLLATHVAFGPLRESPEVGAGLGRALAEIHAARFEQADALGPALELERPPPDWFATRRERALRALREAPALREDVARFLDAREAELRALAGRPVLLQGAFGVATLGWLGDAPWVPDWSAACAGPALLDLGQLLRWGAPGAFVDALAAAYRAGGGSLPEGWRRAAGWCDVLNLCDLLGDSPPGSRRAARLAAKLERAAT